MIEIARSRRIHATAPAIFALLSDPTKLAVLLPRVRSVEVLEQTSDRARLATSMAFGPFGAIRNEGEATWIPNQQVRFVSQSPVFVETIWSLQPTQETTIVQATLRLDLAPLIGPLAAFVPSEQVTAMVAPELDNALVALDRQLQTGRA